MRRDPVAECAGVDGFVAAFEAAQARGEAADVAGFLPPPDHPLYAEVLTELVRVDLELAWGRRQPRRVEEYRDRFPALADPARLGAVAFEEYRLRLQAGERPPASEYRDRLGVSVRGWPEPPRDDTIIAPTAAEEAEPAAAGDGTRYRLGDEIARGGMGAVFRASDPALDREVAVKVLLARPDDPPAMRRRFVAEARIAGRLQHPGVVPVYELARFSDGRPFFAMKLVEGRTLAAVLAARPDPAADLPRLLLIFEQMCQAVAYAHAQGVIHRDLKPANVMVGAFGEVQVMDWGLAKELRVADGLRNETDEPAGEPPSNPHSDGTRAGAVLGTPAYMPPEQARGEAARVDERADVFALGAVLCEILTGTAPYRGEPSEVLFQATRADLAGARDRLAACEGDPELTGLARHCLSAEPADRPRDAGAVARAVADHRAGVERRLRTAELAAAEARARAVEERKRRRVLLALAGSVLFTTLLAAGALLWSQQHWLERTDRASRALAETRALLDAARSAPRSESAPWERAEAAGRVLRELIGTGEVFAATRADAAMLLSELDAGGERAARDRATLVRLAEIRSDVKAEPIDDGFDHETASAEYATAFGRHGIDVSDPARAAELVRESPIRAELLAALNDWLADAREPDLRGRLAATARAAEPDPHGWPAHVRAALATRDPAALKALAGGDLGGVPVETLALWGRVLGRAGHLAESEAVLRTAQRRGPADFWANYELSLRLGRDAPGADELRFAGAAVAVRPGHAAAHNTLARALNRAGRNDDALAALREALRLKPGYAGAHFNLGVLMEQLGRPDDADRAYRDALRHQPNNPFAMANLIALLERRGRADAAAAVYREVIPHLPDPAKAYNNLGVLHWQKGRLDEAEAAYRAAIAARPGYALPHSNLGILLARRGKRADALPLLRESVRLDPHFVNGWYNLGNTLYELKQWGEAEKAHREAIRLRPDVPLAYINLGNDLRKLGRDDEALECYRTAVRYQPNNPLAHANAGNVLEKRDRLDDAEREYRSALALDAAFALAHNGLGIIHRRRGKMAEAEAAHRVALRCDPTLAAAYHQLGAVVQARGRLEEAEALHREAARLDPTASAVRNTLGNVLRERGKADQAEAEFRAAIGLEPERPEPYHNLALLLKAKGQHDEAIELWQKAAERRPGSAQARINLAVALEARGRLAEAAEAYRAAVGFDPKDHKAALSLGNVLSKTGDAPGAEAAYRAALKLNPDYGLAHLNLGVLLKRQGRLAEALAAYRAAERLAGPADTTAASRVRELERLVALDGKLDAVLRGAAQPASPEERVEFARVAHLYRKRYAAAAGLFATALADKADLAADRKRPVRYDAACAAARAAAQTEVSADERVRLGTQARGWLRAELTAWAAEAASGDPARRAAAVKALAWWEADPDLAATRDATADADWRSLWADVAERRAAWGGKP